MHLRKLINTFHKKYLEKPIATLLSLDSALSMAKPTVPKKQPKQKHDRLSNGANKQGRNEGIVLKPLMIFVALEYYAQAFNPEISSLFSSRLPSCFPS